MGRGGDSDQRPETAELVGEHTHQHTQSPGLDSTDGSTPWSPRVGIKNFKKLILPVGTEKRGTNSLFQRRHSNGQEANERFQHSQPQEKANQFKNHKEGSIYTWLSHYYQRKGWEEDIKQVGSRWLRFLLCHAWDPGSNPALTALGKNSVLCSLSPTSLVSVWKSQPWTVNFYGGWMGGWLNGKIRMVRM